MELVGLHIKFSQVVYIPRMLDVFFGLCCESVGVRRRFPLDDERPLPFRLEFTSGLCFVGSDEDEVPFIKLFRSNSVVPPGLCLCLISI
jgi:hypothetical protein